MRKKQQQTRGGGARVEHLEDRQLLTAYYVNPGGSDAADGLSPQTAWQSVAKVDATSFQAGDAVLFAGGSTFGGTLRFGADDAGTAAAPIMVGSYGDSGLRATLSAGNAADGIAVSNTSGLLISGLNVVGAGQANSSYSGIRFDNSLAGNVRLPYVHIDSVDVSGFGKYGITVGGSNGKSGFSDVSITNANVHDNVVGGIETHGVFSSSATGYANAGVYVGHCLVHDNPGFAGSTSHVGDGIVLSDDDGVTIERNVAWNNGAKNTHVGGPVGVWAWDVNRAVIQFNESHHNHTGSTADGGGFDFDGGVTNSVIQYNYSHDNDGPGYALFQFSGARPFHDNVVRYNVSENDARKNGYGAIDLWNGGAGVSNCDVYNNTVYVSPTATGTPRAVYFQSATTNIHVRDNIFQTTGGVTLADVQGKQSGLLFQGNDYCSSGAAFKVRQANKTYSSLTAWRSATGQEKIGTAAVGSSADPRLTAPGSGGTIGNADLLASGLTAYRLQASSPMINTAVNLWTTFNLEPGRQDFYGTALPGTQSAASAYAYDVGAAEWA
jgi:hypothetical protein